MVEEPASSLGRPVGHVPRDLPLPGSKGGVFFSYDFKQPSTFLKPFAILFCNFNCLR